MKITLIDAGKRFNRDWIFRRLQYEFIQGQSYAITGSNGSGKSTLLQAIGGAIGINEGKIEYTADAASKSISVRPDSSARISSIPERFVQIPHDQVFRYISIAAPYLELIEEMTVSEFLHFHQSFKPLLPSLSIKAIIAIVGLEKAAHRQIRYYSSGMKQRVKLAQAIFSDTPVILLDEPCTNLDTEGIELYRRLVQEHCSERLVIVSSNDRQEYDFCRHTISIQDWK